MAQALRTEAGKHPACRLLQSEGREELGEEGVRICITREATTAACLDGCGRLHPASHAPLHGSREAVAPSKGGGHEDGQRSEGGGEQRG